MDNDVLKRAFEELQRYESYLAGEAFRELHEPPFEHGPALKRLAKIRDLLADILHTLSIDYAIAHDEIRPDGAAR